MSKMFYTIDEAAEKLGKTTEELMEMASRGELQTFKQDDQDMFRVEQINTLAEDDDLGDLSISLEDSASDVDPLGLSGSAPAMDLDDSAGGIDLEASSAGDDSSGIALEDSAAAAEDSFLGGSSVSAFDAGPGGDPDLLDDDLSLETVGSGSGLLDLTRESDDTSLGAELLDEVYSSDDDAIPASASGLFDATGADSQPSDDAQMGMPAGAVPMMVETYDGGWSGLGVGMGIVAVAALAMVGLMVLVTGTGTLPALAEMMTGNIMVWFGGLLGGLVIFGVLGYFIGKASE